MEDQARKKNTFYYYDVQDEVLSMTTVRFQLIEKVFSAIKTKRR